MDAAEVIKSLITMEALAPNMMKDIVHSKFEKPDGPGALTEIMKGLPLSIFIRGVQALELETDRETAQAVLISLMEHNKTAKEADKEARKAYLDAALIKVSPPPFRTATIVPGQNYWTERRAANNPRPTDEVLPVEFGPSQLANMIRLERYGTATHEDVPSSKPAVAVGSGWECVKRDGLDGIRAGEEEYTAPQRTTITALNAPFDTPDKSALSKRLGPVARIVYFRNMDITDEDIEYLSKDVPVCSPIEE